VDICCVCACVEVMLCVCLCLWWGGEYLNSYYSDPYQLINVLDVTQSKLVGNFTLLAGAPGVARDEKLRKQIFEIAWRDKGWIG
jgi:hypothetical protein